jgi:magnesium-transporting ATPase (P-type)
MVTVETIGFKNKTTLVELIKYNNGFSPKQHQFFINNNLKNKIYEHKNNTVNQSKYNLITFLPKGILIQFLRFANIYFLVIAVIQMIPVISPLSSSTALVPFLFVLFVSLVREALEDLRRHKFDDQLNSEMVLKYKENKWTNVQSGKLKIGDIIIIEENNVLPADIIILDSSIRDGKCYIETATLDGEKTLKTKLSPLETTNMFKEGESNYATIFDIQGECISDLPCPELYKFNGFLKFSLQNKTHSKQCEIGIDGKQLILKGI